MKSTRKHELQTNELADALGRMIEQVKPHGRIIAYGASAAVVLIIALVVIPWMRAGDVGSQAALEFATAMSGDAPALRIFLRNHADAPQAPTVQLLLAGKILVEVASGVAADPEAKTSPAALLSEARELYTQVAQASPALEPMARVGLALVTVQEGDVARGADDLKAVIARWPESLAAEKAKGHVENLAAYKPITFSNEPLEEPKKPEAPPAGAKPAEAPKMPSAETPKAPEAKPAEAPKTAPVPPPAPAEKKPESKPVG